jgi:putative endonuclease
MPTLPRRQTVAISGAYVYIMASGNRTTYVEVTTNLERRVWEYRTGYNPDSFTSKYKLTKLVYIAEFSRLDDAVAWEKSVKGTSRDKKLAPIAEQNPRWNDLAWDWYGEQAAPAALSASRGDSPAEPQTRSGSEPLLRSG